MVKTWEEQGHRTGVLASLLSRPSGENALPRVLQTVAQYYCSFRCNEFVLQEGNMGIFLSVIVVRYLVFHMGEVVHS